MLRTLTMMLAGATIAFPAMVSAQTADQVRRLSDALGLGPVIELMREEGIEYGDTLEDDLFPGRGGARWDALLEAIYDTDEMRATVERRLGEELAGADLEVMLGFFESERGRRIIELEVTARRALLDETVEEASRDALDDMVLNSDPLLEPLQEFVAANDLIDSNVVGTLNSNVAFMRGMADGGAYPDGMDEGRMLNMVWGQEPEIRDETEAWLYSYLAMAYAPLPDGDLEAYIAFSEAEPGQELNRALFEAFDTMFSTVSYEIGLAAARFVGGEEL